VPPGYLARCYTLTLHDLLKDKNPGDHKLAEEIKVKMAGGYNLPAVEDLFRLKTNHARNEAKLLSEAEAELSRLQNERRGLAEEEDRLGSLEKEREESRAAAQEMIALTNAGELAKKREEVDALRPVLAGFPKGMEDLQGNELERIREIEDEIEELETSIAGYRREISESSSELDENKLPEGPVDETTIATWEERGRRLERLDREREDQDKNREQAGELLAKTAERLGIRGEDIISIELNDRDLEKVDSWIKKAIRVKERRGVIEARLADLSPERNGAQRQVDELRRGADLLRDWLSSPGSPALVKEWSPILWSISGLLVAAGIVLSILLSPWCVILSGMVMGVLVARSASGRGRQDRRAPFRERFEELDIPSPTTWRRSDIRRKLRVMEEDLRKEERTLEDIREVARLQHQLSILDEEARKVREERETIRRAVGFNPAASELAIGDLVDLIRAYRAAALKSSEAKAGFASAEKIYYEELKKLRSFLLQKLGRSPDDSLEARNLLSSLKNRSDRIRNAARKIKNAKKEVAAREAKIQKKRERISKIFQAAALSPTDPVIARRLLTDMLERLDEYRKKKRRLYSLESAVAELSAGLRDRLDLVDLDPSQAEILLEEARQKERQLEDIIGAINKITYRIEEAKHGDSLEQAMAEIKAASLQLEERYIEALRADAGRLLLSKAEEDYEEKSRPAVLDQAARWFSTFTRSRYELRVSVDPGAPVFQALDTDTGRGLKLDELSDATRVQLLLAARLAFATQAERSTSLPLFLDEALTTSDPDRFQAVVQSLIVMVEEGRQIFYLTSNPSDVELFRVVCRNQNKRKPNLINLGRIRKISSAEFKPEMLSLPVPDLIPSPEGLTAARYGNRLEVPTFDPSAPVSSCHLFYILRDDLKLLYNIMENIGVNTIGQWRSFVRFNRNPPGIKPEERDLISARADLLEYFVEQWSIGRGRPLNREVLVESGSISSKYLDKFVELAGELGGDSHRFIECLEEGTDPRARGFRKLKKEQLRLYLEENGFIDQRNRLEREEITAVIMKKHELSGRMPPEEIARRVSELWNLLN